MAAKNTTRKSGQARELPSWFNEAVGIGMIGIGILLMLALISFDKGDVPWFEGAKTKGTHNAIGIMGAYFAGLIILLLGVGSFLLALGLIWLGVVYAFLGGILSKRTLIGMAFFVIIGSCLANVIGFPVDWSLHHGLGEQKPGGVVGYYIGTKVFAALLNTAGAILVLGVGYCIGLIMLTGFQPIDFTRSAWKKFWAWKDSLAEKKRNETDAERAKRERKLERERKYAEKAAEKAAAKEETKLQSEKERATKKVAAEKKQAEEKANEEPQKEMDLKSTPTPQIIDGTQRKTHQAGMMKPFVKEKKTEEELSLSTDAYQHYETPGFDLLDYDDEPVEELQADKDELIATQSTIVETLKAFGVEVTAGDITRGPTITRYEVYPSLGLRVSRITQLEADLARATKAERINILAPIPGKDTVGIEIANDKKVAVPLRELLQDPAFTCAKKKIPLALGKDVYGNTVIADLAAMPHLLVAGATGAGKSVCINSIITSILYKFTPDELRFIMVDPKVVEMAIYGKLPHLVVPVVTDPAKVVAALRWVVNEMEKRYKIFAKCGVRNFDGFNGRPRVEKPVVEPEIEKEPEEEPDPEMVESIARALEDGDIGPPEEIDEEEQALNEMEIPDKFPYIVVIVDELADLMNTAPADVEMNIARIAQKARAAGIHLIIATQTPRADVVTGIIKANIPSRIAFQVSSALDSRVILDTKGADKLVGKGDMLFLPPGSAKLERAQGAFVSDEEVEKIVDFCSSQGEQKFEKSIQDSIEKGGSPEEENEVSDADEEVIVKCLEVIYQEQKASTSLLQRRLRLGYTRAARMMDILEDRGVIGPADGAKAREILGGGGE